MITPYRPVYLPKAYKKFKYVIIHDFSCQFSTIDKARTDDKRAGMQDVRVYDWMFNGSVELPYHFVCEKVNNDYETFMARPFCNLCNYDDIPDQYLNSIHIAVAGNYNFTGMTQRGYQQIAYRSVASVVRWFSISLDRVLMHWEVSKKKDLHCPGDKFSKERFAAVIRQYSLMKK